MNNYENLRNNTENFVVGRVGEMRGGSYFPLRFQEFQIKDANNFVCFIFSSEWEMTGTADETASVKCL